MFQAADAARLAGLTPHQLREWCGTGRRGILQPDVPPAGPGRHALYAWQTLLALRVLHVLHTQFGAELSTWATAIKKLRGLLSKTPFPSLRSAIAVFPCCSEAVLLDDIKRVPMEGCIVIPLASHLVALATELPLSREEQLQLLPPMVVSR